MGDASIGPLVITWPEENHPKPEDWIAVFNAGKRAGAEEMRERAAEIVKHWQQSQNFKLHAGEMSAPEERTAKAVLAAIEQILRALPLEG